MLLIERNKDRKWFETVMNSIIPYHATYNDSYEKHRMIYAIVNNDLTYIKKHLKELCKPENELFRLPFPEDRELAVFNPIYKYYMFLVGELLKRGDNFDILLLGERDNKVKDEELTQLLNEAIDAAMQQMIEEVPEDQRTKPEEIDVQNFKSEMEMFYSSVIDYFKTKFEIKELKRLIFQHALCTDMCFIGIMERNGIPEPVVFNNLHLGFHKSPDVTKIEKGDYWWYRTPITTAQAMEELWDKVPEQTLKRLGDFGGSTNVTPNEGWDITSGKAQNQFNYMHAEEMYARRDFDNRFIGQNTGQLNNHRLNANRLLWKTIIEFKAFKEVIYLTSIDDFGNEIADIVDSSYPIPRDATKVFYTNKWGKDSSRYEWVDDFGKKTYAESLMIPRRYRCTRYQTDIYVDCGEVPNQPLNIDNPYDFELSLKGRIFSGLNAEPISIVERGVSGMMEYVLLKDLELRELSKYEGYIKNIDVSKIPDLGTDADGKPLYEGADKLAIWKHLRRTTGDSYYESTATLNGIPDHQKTTPVKAEVAGSMNEILGIQQVLELIDKQIGLDMLIPPQAVGQYTASSNVTDNQQAISSSYTMLELYYHILNDLMKSLINEYLIQFTNYYKTYFEENSEKGETYLNYILPDGTRKLLTIKPEWLDHEGLGIYLQDTTYNEAYRRNVAQFALQALSQNRGEGSEIISDLVMAISRGESPEKIHKKIRLAAKEQQKQAEKMQEMQAQAAMQVEQAKQQGKQQDHENKLEEIQLTKDLDAQIKALDIYKFNEDKNTDKDGIEDPIETMLKVKASQQKDRELDIKEKIGIMQAKKKPSA